jgi:hypothetical protein
LRKGDVVPPAPPLAEKSLAMVFTGMRHVRH